MSEAETDLGGLLAQVLPADVRVTIRHVSSTPTQCAALFAAPPGESPETTFCENHFLSVSINSDRPDAKENLIFGIEALVYSSSFLTTIFISKADSTGFLHQLKIPPKVSLLRLISNTFLAFLVRTRQRSGVRLVVSLFARAQNQYLFPGSVENEKKHVLDDRGLIKWWCRALEPILRQYEPESTSSEKGLLDRRMESVKNSATAFLIVPGCDRFEVRGFFPPSAKTDAKDRVRWSNSYPRQQLCRHPDAPPRCLVPRFPDDPKTRFLIDLDDELPKGDIGSNSGQWRSVKCLDQFWDMMSFRQECSAGRLVGFLWVVINPPGLVNSTRMVESVSGHNGNGTTSGAESESRAEGAGFRYDPTSTEPKDDGKSAISEPPLASKDPATPKDDPNPFYWPETGRGHVVLSETDYKSAMDFLLQQNFNNEEASEAGTKAWTDHVASLADQLVWGQHVVGTKQYAETAPKSVEANDLMDSGLVRKRKKADTDGESNKEGRDESTTTSGNGKAKAQSGSEQTPKVNVLNTSLVRKKKKT